MEAEFARVAPAPHDVEWVKSRIAHMAEVDQHMRRFIDTPFACKYSEQELGYFRNQFQSRWTKAVGLQTLKEYKSEFKDICHAADVGG